MSALTRVPNAALSPQNARQQRRIGCTLWTSPVAYNMQRSMLYCRGVIGRCGNWVDESHLRGLAETSRTKLTTLPR